MRQTEGAVNEVPWRLGCVACDDEYPGAQPRYRCRCGETLEVRPASGRSARPLERQTFARRLGSPLPVDRSGVWRYRELVLPVDPELVITQGEGNTELYRSAALGAYTGVSDLLLKHEGLNPTGSFKDRGMTVALTVARLLGMNRVACASTGNTAASMASYAAVAGMEAVVFLPDRQIAAAKLSQILAHGARTLQLAGDFDDAMRLVESFCADEGIYLVNSLNPFRIEGQKSVVFELLQRLEWEVPDWIVMPGGNLGNSTAVGKGLRELLRERLIARRPKLAVIQAAGASPLYTAFVTGQPLEPVTAATLATAIKIGSPVSWRECLRGIRELDGVVEKVTDQEILDAKAQVDRAGIGAEPASCAAVAGTRRLAAAGVIGEGESVCVILTGHVLKDPDAVLDYHRGTLSGVGSTYANPPVRVAADRAAIKKAMAR